MWQLRVVDHGEEWFCPLEQENVIIGRQPDCHVVLKDPSVSRKHCTLKLQGRQYILFSGRTKNPPTVNGEEVDTYPLQNGDVIQLGRSQLFMIKKEPLKNTGSKRSKGLSASTRRRQSSAGSERVQQSENVLSASTRRRQSSATPLAHEETLLSAVRNIALLSLLHRHNLVGPRQLNRALAAYNDESAFTQLIFGSGRNQLDPADLSEAVAREKERLKRQCKQGGSNKEQWRWQKFAAVIIVQGGSYILLLVLFLVLLWLLEGMVDIYQVKHTIFGG